MPLSRFPSTPFVVRREAAAQRIAGRRFVVEWIAMGCLGVAAVLFWSMSQATAGIDRLVYDRLLRLTGPAPLPDISIVQIDDASIADFGRWPWGRSMQARLIDAVASAHPAAIVYDVLLTEPTADDSALAQALRRVPSYLPLLLSPSGANGLYLAQLPVPELLSAAAGAGHIEVDPDPDGIVRSVALEKGRESLLTRVDGTAQAHAPWPDLVMPVFRDVRSGTVALPHHRFAQPLPADDFVLAGSAEPTLVPFSRYALERTRVSAEQVLDGEAPVSALRGKIVFVGVTASGLYDHLATPVSGELGPVSDVSMHAEVLDALLTGRLIRPADAHWRVAVSLVALAVLLAGFFVLSPWRALALTVLLGLAAIAASGILLHAANVWLSPVPIVGSLLVLYPIWSWRRLEMTMARLRRELRRLHDEPYLLPETETPPVEASGDVLERHITLLAQAAQRVQDMKRFVWDSLNSVPEPILVADKRGVVLLSNSAARGYFARLDAPAPEGRALAQALSDLAFLKTIHGDDQADTYVRAQWPAVLDPTGGADVRIAKRGMEVRDREGRDYLLRYAECRNAQGEDIGWIAGLVEVTALHAAERHREEALRLLSHDMRSPQASILALVDMAQKRGEASAGDPTAVHETFARIERYARRSLALADDFVQLARAESEAYVLEPVDLTALVMDASDEVWPQAHAKGIRIDTAFEGDAHWVCADRSLMTRVLTNVLTNAVKYSPPNTRVMVTIAAGAPRRIDCTIRDEGYGLSEEAQVQLFERFRRFRAPGQPQESGAGLGMAFVKTVVTRHGGDVGVQSELGRGTALTVSLPAFLESEV
jgi:CHASE2 domain-containing sensor protein/signal transduction histidine kinase